MNCRLCHLHPSRPGADRCQKCAGIHLIRLAPEAERALAAILARHDGMTVHQAISACLIKHNEDEAGGPAVKMGV